jgi:hypothetical protein
MAFWGYKNEEEARQHWPNLDQGKRRTEERFRADGTPYIVTIVELDTFNGRDEIIF